MPEDVKEFYLQHAQDANDAYNTISPYTIMLREHNNDLQNFMSSDCSMEDVVNQVGDWLEEWNHKGDELGLSAATYSYYPKNNFIDDMMKIIRNPIPYKRPKNNIDLISLLYNWDPSVPSAARIEKDWCRNEDGTKRKRKSPQRRNRVKQW